MSNKEITRLALKLFAIYIIVQVILSTPLLFQTYVLLNHGLLYSSQTWFLAISILTLVLLVLLSIGIWKLSNSTASQMISNPHCKLSAFSEEFALSLLGLYLIVYGLSKTVFVSIGAYLSAGDESNVNHEYAQILVYVLVYLTIVIIGMSLVIKAKGWAELLSRLRMLGTK